jgi:hypothetical protein
MFAFGHLINNYNDTLPKKVTKAKKAEPPKPVEPESSSAESSESDSESEDEKAAAKANGKTTNGAVCSPYFHCSEICTYTTRS